MVLVAGNRVSAVWGVRILVWEPKKAQHLDCDGAEVAFKAD